MMTWETIQLIKMEPKKAPQNLLTWKAPTSPAEPAEKSNFGKIFVIKTPFREFLTRRSLQIRFQQIFSRILRNLSFSTLLSKTIAHDLSSIVNHTVQRPPDVHLNLSPQPKPIYPPHHGNIRKHRLHDPSPSMINLPPRS
jgi:hypothetical protein